MALWIKYTAECDCGGTMSTKELDLSQEPGEKVEINLDMLGDFVLECNKCDDRTYVPQIMDYAENLED
jgi:hypothetical protein